MPNWVVQYVFKGSGGETSISVSRVFAATEKEAREFAARIAPFEEFVLSVHPESEDQFLGTVKQQAKILSGYGVRNIDDPEE